MTAIDKSWINLGNRNSPDFKNGLNNFIEIAKNHVNSEGKAFCPCRGCVNSKRQDLKTIYDHVHSRGFLRAYQIWHYQGEKFPNHDEIASKFAPRTHPKTTNHEIFGVIDDVKAEQDANEENIYEDGTGGTGLDTESYTQKRWVENQYPSYIEGFHNTRCKGGVWVTEIAQRDYERSRGEADRVQSQINEDYEEHDILGERQGLRKGVGRLLSRPTPIVSGDLSGSSSQDWLERLKVELQAQHQQKMEEYFQKMSQDFDKKLKEVKEEWRRKCDDDSND